MTDRKRGGQPGNTNALQHGFYSRQMKAGEIADLSAIAPDLNSEIAMLRVLAARAVAAANTNNATKEYSLDEWAMLLNSLGTTFVRIATLTRTQALLGKGDQTANACLSEALANVLADWKITQK
jgi:hypothetical protein